MSDLSRADLKKKIQAILKDADLEKTSAKKVRQELEDEMKCDLKDRKDEINDIINDVIDEQEAANGEDESGEEVSPNENYHEMKTSQGPSRLCLKRSGCRNETHDRIIFVQGIAASFQCRVCSRNRASV